MNGLASLIDDTPEEDDDDDDDVAVKSPANSACASRKRLRQMTIEESMFGLPPPRLPRAPVVVTSVASADEVRQLEERESLALPRRYSIVAESSDACTRAAEMRRMHETIARARKTIHNRIARGGQRQSGVVGTASHGQQVQGDRCERPSIDLDALRDWNEMLPDLNNPSSPADTVLFSIQSLSATTPPRPFPVVALDDSFGWDQGMNVVRSPFSSRNAKAPAIREALEGLLTPLTSIRLVESAILSYNDSSWRFDSLYRLFDAIEEDARQRLLTTVLPGMARLALALPNLITQPLPMLRAHRAGSVSLSAEQCASLLANAFFCTFPCRGDSTRRSSTLPEINFNRLFTAGRQSKVEKLRCILHYFDGVIENMPCGTLSIRRLVCSHFPDWPARTEALCDLVVSTGGTIEDDGHGMLEMDFANQYIGGGVLGAGCVQEEIRFAICPELIVACALCERMDENEAIRVVGARRFSDYTGYGEKFKWKRREPCDKSEPIRDRFERAHVEVVAIDARPFRVFDEQYSRRAVERELNKAFVGFANELNVAQGVATGNWGCGVFGGDAHLKSLLQVMAASVCRRSIAYFTFSNERFARDLQEIHSFLREKNVSVGQLFDLIGRFSMEKCQFDSAYTIFQFLSDVLKEPVISP